MSSMLVREHSSEEIKKPKERELELRTPAEMVKDWVRGIEGDIDRPLTTCIPKFDKVLRNKLRGTVGAYIGKGGSKKSLLALQGCKTNVWTHMNNCTGVYSNMEMGTWQFMSRLMDMSFTAEEWAYNSSHFYEREYEKCYRAGDKEGMRLIEKALTDNFETHYGKNLYVNSQSGMRIEDFERLLKLAKDKNGKVDMLAVDGLSMMSGQGTETEMYTSNSKELKDLAKMYNIYVVLICHVTKAATKHTRDLQEFIRGSEKILDNVDFQIMFSLLIDEMRSGAATEYIEDKGYLRLYDKRGSGKTVNVIYKFDSSTLTIQETEEDPMLYEVDKTKKIF